MTGAEPLFIDTNILIYANAASAPLHEQALKTIKEAYQNECPLWISQSGAPAPKSPQATALYSIGGWNAELSCGIGGHLS